ncbi:MAG: outer membrane protein assembly factor BamA [Candidatus Aminicenantes bacterium RBG_13_62_12]|nr:MAG: outer membrane protein assembly factor BamA [Candidatus Aminicenantes bacterium RBG_13_62_12]
MMLFAAVLALSLPLLSQDFIDKIEIVGNDRVTQETILYYITAREGDYFNEAQLRNDFRVLWTTGFFSDIRMERLPGARGVVVRITVKENPVIRSVTYKTGKKVKEEDITNKLKEKDEFILPYSYYSSYKIQRIQGTIEELLAEKGLMAAKVEAVETPRGKNEVEVEFKINEGPKVRVGQVVFEGTTKVPASVLEGAMAANRGHNLISWVSGKDVFKENKIQEAMDGIKKKFQEYGYMEAQVGEPRLEEFTRRTAFPLFKKQKMMRIVIPVQPGYIYRVGEISVEGAKSVPPAYLRAMIAFRPGDIYNTKVREKAVEKIGEVFRDGGFLYSQIMPVESLDPKKKTVNVAFNIQEGDVCYISRLEFKGNFYTKDKVIRREMFLREGDRFSFTVFKNSLLRMRQLGLVDLEGDPEIKPTEKNPALFDVTVNVKELQRNNIQFTAGYSGYEGAFIALSYETVNFLGAGENLNLTFQHGKRIKNYSFGFQEPYIFDYPLSLGFNIYNRYLIYPYLYDRKGKGLDLIFGARLFSYWRANMTYTFEDVDISPPSEGDGSYSSYYSYYSSYMSLYGMGTHLISSLSPSIYYSTVDSPLTPSRGSMILASLKYAGTFLGGEIDLIRPRFELTHWQPIFPKHSIGVHLEYEFIRPIGGAALPFWEKIYLGGERNIRGYEIYTIGPGAIDGTNMGGQKAIVFNAEYSVAVGGPLYLILFHDMGNSWTLEQKMTLSNIYMSSGIEARVFVPALRVPFRLIFSYNNRKIRAGDNNFAFRFAIGATF